jgi:site-specific DNA-methyltransferase (adenine-specific)
MMLETNKNYFSDNREILKSIPDKSINLFLEDMPYNTTQCDWEYEVDLKEYWELRLPKLADNGVFILTGVEPFSSKLRLSNDKMYRVDWIWEKDSAGNFMSIDYNPFKIFENVIVFSKSSSITFNPIRIERNDASLKRYKIGNENIIKRNKKEGAEHYNINYVQSSISSDGYKHPNNIVYFPKFDTDRYAGIKHPTRKPIALFEYFIKTYTNENDIVFDGYSGSGTTAIACIRNNRKYIICENKKEYYDLQTKRILEEIDKTSLFNESLGGRQDRISA